MVQNMMCVYTLRSLTLLFVLLRMFSLGWVSGSWIAALGRERRKELLAGGQTGLQTASCRRPCPKKQNKTTAVPLFLHFPLVYPTTARPYSIATALTAMWNSLSRYVYLFNWNSFAIKCTKLSFCLETVFSYLVYWPAHKDNTIFAGWMTVTWGNVFSLKSLLSYILKSTNLLQDWNGHFLNVKLGAGWQN